MGMSIYANHSMYYQFCRYKLEMGTYESFLKTGYGGVQYFEAKEMADYVAPRTSTDDYVYLWSDHMMFYNLAHRRAPVENQWPYYADAFGPPDRIFGPRTKYILASYSPLMARPAWLYDQLKRHYVREAVISGHEIYRFNE